MLPRSLALAALLAALAGPSLAQDAPPAKSEVATFAGGCFWCVESDFDAVPGVLSTVSGYTGGHVENPTYRDVTSETSGHKEAVQITYDPTQVTYERLLDIFWRSVDPTDAGGQFCDRGDSYRTMIFANSDAQLKAAEASKAALEASGKLPAPIVTEIVTAPTFWPAEDYHQDYYLKNPVRYQYYRTGCGRDERLKEVWGEEALAGIKHGS